MAIDMKKARRQMALEKAREKAEQEQTVVVGKWPNRPIITKKQAEYEYGEDMGPWLAKLINSGRRRRSRRPDLEKLILTWAKENDLEVSVYQLPPKATAETWKRAINWCRKEEAAGNLAMVVVGT